MVWEFPPLLKVENLCKKLLPFWQTLRGHVLHGCPIVQPSTASSGAIRNKLEFQKPDPMTISSGNTFEKEVAQNYLQ